MIEVPAAAIALPGMISKLDFIAIGTNDLCSTRSRSTATTTSWRIFTIRCIRPC